MPPSVRPPRRNGKPWECYRPPPAAEHFPCSWTYELINGGFEAWRYCIGPGLTTAFLGGAGSVNKHACEMLRAGSGTEIIRHPLYSQSWIRMRCQIPFVEPDPSVNLTVVPVAINHTNFNQHGTGRAVLDRRLICESPKCATMVIYVAIIVSFQALLCVTTANALRDRKDMVHTACTYVGVP